jgi:hypothetical protein
MRWVRVSNRFTHIPLKAPRADIRVQFSRSSLLDPDRNHRYITNLGVGTGTEEHGGGVAPLSFCDVHDVRVGCSLLLFSSKRYSTVLVP